MCAHTYITLAIGAIGSARVRSTHLVSMTWTGRRRKSSTLRWVEHTFDSPGSRVTGQYFSLAFTTRANSSYFWGPRDWAGLSAGRCINRHPFIYIRGQPSTSEDVGFEWFHDDTFGMDLVGDCVLRVCLKVLSSPVTDADSSSDQHPGLNASSRECQGQTG
jgi:hypothetical protein